MCWYRCRPLSACQLHLSACMCIVDWKWSKHVMTCIVGMVAFSAWLSCILVGIPVQPICPPQHACLAACPPCIACITGTLACFACTSASLLRLHVDMDSLYAATVCTCARLRCVGMACASAAAVGILPLLSRCSHPFLSQDSACNYAAGQCIWPVVTELASLRLLARGRRAWPRHCRCLPVDPQLMELSRGSCERSSLLTSSTRHAACT